MNMSYCKMENTNLALAQCLEDLEAVINGNAPEGGEALSESECAAAAEMLKKVAALYARMQEAWGEDAADEDAIDDAVRSNNEMVKERLAEEEHE
jgi:hypothetical protein